MSNKVSREQETVIGSKLLRSEELSKVAMKVLNDGDHFTAIARVNIGHSQVVHAILENKGVNNC